VDAVFVSDLIARKVTATFRQPFAGPAIATLSQLPKYLMEWAYWSAENASCDLLTTLCSAATSCTWLASPSHEIVMLHLNSRLLRCDPATDPLSQAQVQGLVNTYGDAFDRGLQLWLEHFAQEVADVRPLLAKFVQGPISDAVAAGLVAYSTRISAADRFTLVASHLQLDAATAASDQFLAACQFRLSDQVQAAQHLLKLYEQATRNPERSTVVRYIRALAPTGNPRRDLVEVLVKMARLNKQSLETVLRNSDLLDPPPTGLRIAIREALSKGIKDRHQKEHAKQVLVSLGLIQVTPTWRGDSVRPVD
jgi:hypothetical protein